MDFGMDRAWIEINLDIIRENYRKALAKLDGKTKIMAVLKANAYGLGARPIGKVLEEEGCPLFSLVLLEEAMGLREYGLKTPILLLGPINPIHTEICIDNNIAISFINYEQAIAVSEAALACGKKIKGHIKLDTGLSRLGIVLNNRPEEAFAEISEIIKLEGIEVTGIYTHLTDGEIPGGEALDLFEIGLFDSMAEKLHSAGYELETHCLATSPAMKYDYSRYSYIRVGALLTGLNLNETKEFDIEQSIELKCSVAQVKELEKGTPVSYGPLFHTLRKTIVAVINLGYADGIRRTIANKGKLIIKGRFAPVIGKTCCDHTIIDVTDIPGVKAGDIVTVFGREEDAFQPVDRFCPLYPASVAEITSEISHRLPRFFTSGGKIVMEEHIGQMKFPIK